MGIKKHFSLFVLVVVTLLALYSSPVAGCSCMPSHPQTHFCTADYVAQIRVLRKSDRILSNKVVYKVQIKKTYKLTAEGLKALKHERIISSGSDSMCGVNLDIGKVYVVAGRGSHLTTCSYVKEYMKMSIIERRGFLSIYNKGCGCEVKPCFGTQCAQRSELSGSCRWSPFAKCETTFSACTPITYATPEGNISKCHWRRTDAYKKCMRDP